MAEPRATLGLFASFRWPATALRAFVHGFVRREVRGLLEARTGLVVTNVVL